MPIERASPDSWSGCITLLSQAKTLEPSCHTALHPISRFASSWREGLAQLIDASAAMARPKVALSGLLLPYSRGLLCRPHNALTIGRMHVGRRWQISSDFLPVLAIAGVASHVIWFIIVGSLFIISKPSSCHDSTTDGRLLESVLDGTLIIMAISCALEVPIIIFGLQGRHPAPRPSCLPSECTHAPALPDCWSGASKLSRLQAPEMTAAQGHRSRSPSDTGFGTSCGRGSSFGLCNSSSTVSTAFLRFIAPARCRPRC